MGKRELLLIAAFVLVGVVVYQVTAPATPASGGFSLSGLIAKIRSEIHGQDVQIPVVRSATASVPASVKTLKIDGLRASVTILGEAREDVTAELRATAFGADEAQARAFEQAFQLELAPEDDLLELRVKGAGQEMRRRRIELTIRVPSRLTLELALLGGELKVSHVARVTFERGAGRAVLSEIADGVEGEYGPARSRSTWLAPSSSKRIVPSCGFHGSPGARSFRRRATSCGCATCRARPRCRWNAWKPRARICADR